MPGRDPKEDLRAAQAGKGLSRSEAAKAAEQLRRLAAYRQAGVLFASPATALAQVRSNALADGKQLLMPGPRLREGFYLLKPYVIPFRDLNWAVTFPGLLKLGIRLDRQALARLSVEMLLTDAVAVDSEGGMLGEGMGFFDLAWAILAESGALTREAVALGILSEAQILSQPLLLEAWDARLDGIVTPAGYREFPGIGKPHPRIHWEALPFRRIRRVTPLWQLYQEQRRGVNGEQ